MRAPRSAVRLPLVALAAASLLSACDPCAGTVGCSVAPRVSYTGRTVHYRENRIVPGVRLEFERTGGVELVDERLVAVSDAEGWFRLVGEAADSAGEVIGRLTVTPPPPQAAYTVEGVRLRTTAIDGDGGDLGRVVVDPYVALIGEIRSLATRGILPDAHVEFRRTGGVSLSPAEFLWSTDKGGRFFLSGAPGTYGQVEGELIVQSPALPKVYRIPFRVDTEWRDGVPEAVRVVSLGTGLVYVGDIYQRGSFKGIPGVEVEFTRTGGVATDPARVVVRTDAAGRFPIVLTPAEDGEVVGTLDVRPPAPYRGFTVTGVRLRTFETDSIGLVGRWGIGAQVFGALELFSRATQQRLPGGLVTVFRRTGGIRIDPDTAVERTSPFGAVAIRGAALEAGEVVGDLEVRLPAPFSTDVVRGIRAQSREDDTQVYLGRANVGAWLGYVGHVSGPDGRGVPNAQVEFRRTGGIDVAQPYVTTSNGDGYFPLTMAPRAEGEVVGDVVITPPAPYRATTVTGVRLQTYASDEVKFVASWRVQ
jgi:hypothetical protein